MQLVLILLSNLQHVAVLCLIWSYRIYTLGYCCSHRYLAAVGLGACKQSWERPNCHNAVRQCKRSIFDLKLMTNITPSFNKQLWKWRVRVHPVWPWQQVCVRPVWNGGDASIMNIHYDVTGLLTVVWRSHSGQIVWPAGVGQGRGGF